MPNCFFAAALFAFLSPLATGQDALDALVEGVHRKQQNVGVAVTMYRAGERIYEKYLGMADLENGVQVHRGIRLGIASVTKLFTATTLLIMRGEGEVDLDARVQEYVPEFPVKPQGESTLRMLATHRAGIPHPQDRTPKLFATHYETATDALEVFTDEPLTFVPDSEAGYSSSNYNLLTAAIEGAAGQTFQSVVKARLLKPLARVIHEPRGETPRFGPCRCLASIGPADDLVRSSRTPMLAKCRQGLKGRRSRPFVGFRPRGHE
ncbi:MAG: CubicO group peptidase (beta-lactamase class C family) [Chlamydiales bacterium]|jgi:CubicO group peptidase (beta-lactamase class C family)